MTDLHSPDISVRRAAVQAIQTCDDPRIPAACFPLLGDVGDSIRRQAARAIGSRFAQIPATDRGRYITALRACAAAGPDDVTLICQRAIGLLTRDYSFASFSVSPNGKWVLYERRRLPVIANIARQQHELLSPFDPATAGATDDVAHDTGIEGSEDYEHAPVTDSLLEMVVTNEPAEALFAPHWQPGGNAIAFTLETLEMRFYHPILVWSASNRDVQVLNFERFQSLLGSRKHEWGTTTEFVGWKGDRVLVRIFDYLTDSETRSNDVIVSYNISNGKIVLESRSAAHN